MAELFASGRIIDAILVLVALEALALAGWRMRRGRGPALVPLLANLASGASLMLAVRAALTGADWTIVAAFMVAALSAHLTEVCLRLRNDASRSLGRRRDDGSAGTSTQTAAFSARP